MWSGLARRGAGAIWSGMVRQVRQGAIGRALSGLARSGESRSGEAGLVCFVIVRRVELGFGESRSGEAG